MSDKDKELYFVLTVKQNSDGIEHELDINIEGYPLSATQDIQDIVKEDVDYLVEDLRRRVTRI